MMAAKAVGIDPYIAAEAGENAKAALNAIRNAGKAKSAKDRVAFIREANNELRSISSAKHSKLVNAIQAKLLALQGRGGGREIAHLTPGEVVIPRSLQTPELMRAIATEAARQGINPARYIVGHKANPVNPRTATREFNGCNPGDPGECFSFGNGSNGASLGTITTIGYVKPDPTPNYNGGLIGVTYDGPNLLPNFGDGVGSDAETGDTQTAVNIFYDMCEHGLQSPCCESKDSRVEPPRTEIPSQRVLDGLSAYELEGTMNTYDVAAYWLDFASNVFDVRKVIKNAIEGAANESIKSVLRIFDRMLDDGHSRNTLANKARSIANTYRNELKTRMATCGSVKT